MTKITKEDLDYICDALVKAFTVDRHIAVEPDAINEIRRLARLGLWAEEEALPTLRNSQSHGFYCPWIEKKELNTDPHECDACNSLRALPKEAP